LGCIEPKSNRAGETVGNPNRLFGTYTEHSGLGFLASFELREGTMAQHNVFLTGSTGFLGRSLAAELLRRGHRVRALVRPGSESRVVPGCELVAGDALRAESYADRVTPSETFVHLIGVAHPSPSKAEEFRKIDLVSCREAVQAAKQAGIQYFVYLSVARPAPMMKEYQAVRAEGERMVTDSGIPATFVRPWYVLGPGRSWPVLLKPFYALARAYPPTRDGAIRLDLVTLEQMTQTLAAAVENPPETLQLFEPPQIKLGGKTAAAWEPRAASA
jgi:uncharacterized protein YbjT (DUF2867 family)